MSGDEEHAVHLEFFVQGHGCNSVDNGLVCATWCVPPTDFDHPVLVVKTAPRKLVLPVRPPAQGDATAAVGCEVCYEAPYLGFNTAATLADGSDIPVLVKTINGYPYLVLMRSHLPPSQLFQIMHSIQS